MKKLLAMVLALVMTLSLAVSANAAFKDVKDIDETYAESAAVLNGLGVFKGYEEKDGTFSFQPKNAITRAEVAAIVYRIYTQDVKDTYVKNYETYNKFGDMAGAGWAKGYIGYCANAALVKGYPNGTFVPSGKVTGYEVLAMILRAVGYDQKNEFTGADWALHVAEIAERQGILDNVKGVDLNAPATREVVAELLFQSIKVPMVTYTAAFGYQNVGLNEKADNKLFAKNETLGTKNFKLGSYEGYITYNAKKEAMVLTEKGEKAADDVIITVADQDVFDAGRYGHVWTSDKKAITDVFYDDTLLATKYESWNTDWTTKNKTDFVATKDDGVKYFLNGNGDAKAADIEAALAVKGSEKALYDIDADGDIDTVIVINPEVGVMDADYMVKGSSVKINGKIYKDSEIDGYKDLVKGDVFTSVKMVDDVTYFEELAPIVGQKTLYTKPSKADPYITFADKEYEQSGLKYTSDIANLFSDHIKHKDTFNVDATIYLDRGGYVVYTKNEADTYTTAMVIDSYSVLNDKHNGLEYYVNLLLTDGTETGYVAVDNKKSDIYFQNVLFSSSRYNTYAPEAVGGYEGLGTLVKFNVKDNVYTVKMLDTQYGELDNKYVKGNASMDIQPLTINNDKVEKDGNPARKAVDSKSVVYYFDLIETAKDTYTVSYGVNTGKGEIPSYLKGDRGVFVTDYDATKDQSPLDGDLLNYAVMAYTTPNDDYENYTLLFKQLSWSSTGDKYGVYTYLGVNDEGIVEEFKSYDDKDLFETYAYAKHSDGMVSFDEIAMSDDVSVTKMGTTAEGGRDTVKVRAEGKNSDAIYYLNQNKVLDLTADAIDEYKAGDTVKTYTWDWLDNDTVKAVAIFDVKNGNKVPGYIDWDSVNLEVEVAYVTDADVIYGEFDISVNSQAAVTYWYPISNFVDKDSSKYVAKAYTLEWLDEDNNTDYYTGTYHDVTDPKSESYGSEVITGDSKANPAVAGTKLTFDKNDELKLVSCKKVGTVTEVKYDGTALVYNADAKAYKLVLKDTETFDQYKVAVTAANADYPKTEIVKDGKLVTITLTSVDGFCKGEAKIKLVSSNADLDSVTIDGTEATIPTARTEAKAESAEYLGSKAKFTLTATAAEKDAKVEIGSGDTLANAVKNLSERDSVTVTESTELNGGFVVIKVTAENGDVLNYVYSTATAPATGN